MSHPRHRLARLALTATLVLAPALALSACGGDDEAASGSGTPEAGRTGASGGSDVTDDEAGELSSDSPFVVAASAVAARSRDQVLQIHAMAVATTGDDGGFPPDQVAGIARSVRQELGRQVTDATMATPPRGSAAARLVAALRVYQELADELAGWRPAAGAVPAAFVRRLEAADVRWQDALAELGELSGEDLLADLPELVLPE